MEKINQPMKPFQFFNGNKWYHLLLGQTDPILFSGFLKHELWIDHTILCYTFKSTCFQHINPNFTCILGLYGIIDLIYMKSFLVSSKESRDYELFMSYYL